MGISDLKRVLLSSFHSSVIDAIMKEDYEPANILSFDSHLNVDIVGALETVWNAVRGYNGYDKGLHFALTDSAIHMLARKWFPNTEIKIVTPRVCMEGEVKAESYWLKQLDISLALSPPKDIVSFATLVNNDTVIDVDFDYLGDLQNEIYIPRMGPDYKPYEFGSLERLLRLIRATKPDLITCSEATIAALNDPNSKTNYFLGKLRNMGYEIKKHFLFSSDEEAIARLVIIRRFSIYLENNSSSEPDRSLDEIEDAANDFFAG